jgi:hypothetical protein
MERLFRQIELTDGATEQAKTIVLKAINSEISSIENKIYSLKQVLETLESELAKKADLFYQIDNYKLIEHEYDNWRLNRPLKPLPSSPPPDPQTEFLKSLSTETKRAEIENFLWTLPAPERELQCWRGALLSCTNGFLGPLECYLDYLDQERPLTELMEWAIASEQKEIIDFLTFKGIIKTEKALNWEKDIINRSNPPEESA